MAAHAARLVGAEAVIKVWILLIFMGGTYQGGPVVIDNIATGSECARVQQMVISQNIP